MHIMYPQNLHQKIYDIRGYKVILDYDLAVLYDVQTRALNQAVKRHASRFPPDFMFRLTKEETASLISQNVISSWGGNRKLPNAFTEQGVAMLSGLLNSEKAIKVNIAIMRAFVEMRKILVVENSFENQLAMLRRELEMRLGEQDTQILEIYRVLEEMMDNKQLGPERNKIGFK